MKRDFWNKHKIGTRLMFLTIWAVFVGCAVCSFLEIQLSPHFLEIVETLVIYITLFISVGLNGLEIAGKTIEKIKLPKKEKNTNNIDTCSNNMYGGI